MCDVPNLCQIGYCLHRGGEVFTDLVSRDEAEKSLRLLDFISCAEREAMGLLIRFYNYRQDVALALCQIGRQKIRVLAQLAEVLASIDEAPFQGDVEEEVPWDLRFRFYWEEVMSRVWVPVAEVAQGLAQHLSNLDLEICDEVRAVLLGIRSMATLPIIARRADAWHTSFWKDLVVGRFGQHFEVHARFPALGMRPTSEDLQRFKDQIRSVCKAVISSAVSPSVTVTEGKHNWLQRQEPESRSEMDGWQQVPSAGSWTLCSAAQDSLQQASSTGSWTLCSSSSTGTWDVVDQ
eukprot:s6024_g2.t1